MEAYGQSESTGPSFTTIPIDTDSSGHVGAPISTCEYRLADVPEMNYLTKN